MSGMPVTLDATLLIVAGIVAITVAYWLGVVTCWYAGTRALQDDEGQGQGQGQGEGRP